MARSLRHRGPDDEGIWVESQQMLGFAHTRLSIIDLSAAGHQPMTSANGRYVIAFNGEIYNHSSLRQRLEDSGQSPPWAGHSDTETLLAAFEQWGIHQALEQTNGMFAIAVWDARERRLTLARDRMGEKPLYFGWMGRQFAFASEFKAIAACEGWNPEMNRDAAIGFLHRGYVRGHQSIVRNFHRLPPGNCLTLEITDLGSPRDWHWVKQRLHAYWSVHQAASSGLAQPVSQHESPLADTVESALREAVRSRMAADVPIGVFLSGGIDSSLVTALMQAEAGRRVRSFSIGFRETAFDEAPHAREVAQHLGTDHTELYVSPGDALGVIPLLPDIYDEPFADVSQLPTVLLARLTSAHVKVALSGDGGDELFAGYARYFAITRLWGLMKHVTPPLRRGLADMLGRAAPGLGVLGGARREHQLALQFRLRRLAARARGGSLMELQDAFLSGALVPGWLQGQSAGAPSESVPPAATGEDLRQLMQDDQLDYLPDDILVKVDRATMFSSLESRAPLLDHRLVELSWRLPLSSLHSGAAGKKVLKEVLYRHVPRALVDRPKQGFDVPVGAWLRGPLRSWAEELLLAPELDGLSFVDARLVRRRWRDHLEGRINIEYALWSVLMLLAWMRRWRVS